MTRQSFVVFLHLKISSRVELLCMACIKFTRLMITDEDSVPEMRTWSVLFIKSDLKRFKLLRKAAFHILHTFR